MKSKRLHSTSIVIEDIGVLIIGEPGAGKSDLAMRLIDSGATLIQIYSSLIYQGPLFPSNLTKALLRRNNLS